ncbi:MAG: hypothetical protein QM621_00600 [Aeromicrobium sp.]|uniref:hypothetical protein n=1 Tax=Aeromicrobium sp. TaxID=1871063 RepID=UPI0039E3B227
MLDSTILERVDQLSATELIELRDAIEVKLGHDVPAGQWALLERRVADADARPDDHITLDEWKARRRARRA